MKSALGIFLAIALCAVSALAEPLLTVDATVTETLTDGTKDIYIAEPVAVPSGGVTVIRHGDLEFTITSIVEREVNVTSRIVITRREGGEARVLARPAIITRLGQKAEISTGNLSVALTTALKK